MKRTILLWMIVVNILLLAGCGNENTTVDVSGTYTVEVKTDGGRALENIGVYIYTDESQDDIVAVGKTDGDGLFSFQSEDAMGCVIILKDVPLGYEPEKNSEIKEKNTRIVLEAVLPAADDLSEMTFEPGDVFADMSVTATDGEIYTISELLKEKKAVVLNFWYMSCAPCRSEFPYLQEAYEQYKDDIEILAVNPVDDKNKDIAEFKEELGLTFPMAACSADWEKAMELTAYPTTVVIDRYGAIALIHRGTVPDAEEFKKVFEFFTAEDYTQVVLNDFDEIN